mmetsp:Transcript_41961/g.94802  ORF Transcript_41961/g.94802 Transcript_41961/m.94802 type:complete len:213 (+) Transcript_41961:72-710(+)
MIPSPSLSLRIHAPLHTSSRVHRVRCARSMASCQRPIRSYKIMRSRSFEVGPREKACDACLRAALLSACDCSELNGRPPTLWACELCSTAAAAASRRSISFSVRATMCSRGVTKRGGGDDAAASWEASRLRPRMAAALLRGPRVSLDWQPNNPSRELVAPRERARGLGEQETELAGTRGGSNTELAIRTGSNVLGRIWLCGIGGVGGSSQLG